MDFAFGTYSNDALKIANHCPGRTGIQHQNDITPLDPVPGKRVIVHIVTSGDTGIAHAALYYTTDETTPAGTCGADSIDETARPAHLILRHRDWLKSHHQRTGCRTRSRAYGDDLG